MLWINIPTEFLSSVAFRCCDPTERSTWLSLLGHCAAEENGGRISGARLWKDRQWQQVVGVTSREVGRNCCLWAWDGDDLVVDHYPVEREAEIRAKREAGRTRALQRWKGRSTQKATSSGDSSAISSPSSLTSEKLDRERNGTERNGNTPQPPSGGVGAESAFEQFWLIVPARRGKGAAAKAFLRQAKTHGSRKILTGCARYLAAEQVRQKAKPDDYQPLHPATWLNQERFLDDPSGIPVPTDEVIKVAWRAAGLNGDGPPDWRELTRHQDKLAAMRAACPAFDLLAEGIEECVQIIHGLPS